MKGSFSTTEHDSEGLMKWNSVDEGKEWRGSYEKVPERPVQFLVSSFSCFGVVITMLSISSSWRREGLRGALGRWGSKAEEIV